MQFGIMFFSGTSHGCGPDRYSLLKRAARLADERGFCAVWTPERHFHEFGGLFPNPSVTGAALAMITDQIQIRAGSLISPLHDPVRVAEDWALVDNLSQGRVAISFGSGWNVDDFVFFPERYSNRQAIMYEQIEIVQRLWGGGSIMLSNGNGKLTEVRISPTPLQPRLPIWITSSGNAETFAAAGMRGLNVLTHLLGQDVPTLADKIAAYREARGKHGFDPLGGTVTLMLHTFMGDDLGRVRAKVRSPFREYLRSAVGLETKSAKGGGVISGGHRMSAEDIAPSNMEALLDITFDRYFNGGALMGTPETCRAFVCALKEIGVDEIACLIDFGVDNEAVLESLEYVDQLRAYFTAPPLAFAAPFMESLED